MSSDIMVAAIRLLLVGQQVRRAAFMTTKLQTGSRRKNFCFAQAPKLQKVVWQQHRIRHAARRILHVFTCIEMTLRYDTA